MRMKSGKLVAGPGPLLQIPQGYAKRFGQDYVGNIEIGS